MNILNAVLSPLAQVGSRKAENGIVSKFRLPTSDFRFEKISFGFPGYLILLTLLLSGCSASRSQSSKKGVSLFNGKDLSGWVVHGTEKWYVENGELVCESGPDKAYGYLATAKQYKDMDLTVDFKQEANGNSGVFFHSSLEGIIITGWQAEVAPPGSNTGGIYESYGRGWLIKPDPADEKAAFRPGDWNTLRVRVVGDEVTTWLNGKQMITLKDEKIGQATGQIALQIREGGGIKVRWRNLRVVEL